ncbi:MAG: hypothetical protein IJG37_07045, partial [Synergistaceae bacterium]|nr:hypothetical protein [Synergistaceae bacterium]
EKIDGVINMYYNPCQLPYQEICERLGLPCFATKEQHQIFTDKRLFLKACAENGVDIIPQYSVEDFASDNPNVEYPVYVKPSDSRGSRGQSICHSYGEVKAAILRAKSESTNGEVLIEKYMGHAQDITMCYFMVDGELRMEYIVDKYNANPEDGFPGSVLCGAAPSVNARVITENSRPQVERMLKNLGFINAPVFVQGFVDGEKFRVYDPALRLPAGLYDLALRDITGFDLFRAMIEFALNGKFPAYMHDIEKTIPLNGNHYVSMWVFLRPGTISEIHGLDKLRSREHVFSVMPKYKEGDKIEEWRDIRQSFCEVVIFCEDIKELRGAIRGMYSDLEILDENGKDMKTAFFDPDILR